MRMSLHIMEPSNVKRERQPKIRASSLHANYGYGVIFQGM